MIKTHGSLFTGIGGFDLAADWMGWETVLQCEINENLRYLLNQLWPNAKIYADIKSTDFTIWRGLIDVLTGGFPCQPYSLSGKRKGRDDERHLWPEMLRAVREAQPRWVVAENVLGITSWDGGVVFNEVQADLEAEGYQVQTYVLPAAGVGAPHERSRVWFVAYRNKWSRSKHGLCPGGEVSEENSNKTSSNTKHNGSNQGKQAGSSEFSNQDAQTGSDTYSSVPGLEKFFRERRNNEQKCPAPERNYLRWDKFPTQSPVCPRNDGLFTESLRQLIREDCNGLLTEKEIDKILSKALIRWRIETLQAGGNAIVPQVIFQIFKAIEEYTNL